MSLQKGDIVLVPFPFTGSNTAGFVTETLQR
jgi:hypothetical protein